MIRIVIADTHKVFSKALHRVLSSEANFQVICICSGNDAAIDVVRSERPDIVFLDMSHAPAAAADTLKKMMAVTKAKVIAISAQLDPAYAKNMLHAGAMGYLTKNAPLAEVLTAVNEIAAGNLYIGHESKTAVQSFALPAANPQKAGVSIRTSTREFFQTVENHWHHILKFAN